MKKNYLLICMMLLGLSLSNHLHAQSCADGSVSYDDDIAPILAAKCGSCHGTQGGYSVANYASTLAGGNNCGPAVTPGDATAASSSLIDKTQWVNGGPNANCLNNMPTGGTPLTAAEFQLIETWITEGAQEACPAPPANDLCADAITLTVEANEACVPVSGDNTNATDSTDGAPTCASYAGGDTWFSITVPASGDVTVEVDDNGGFTDGGMSIYSGTCGALTQIECDDDDGPGLFPLIALTGQTPGDILLVQVWEFGNNAFGAFNICAYEPAPPPPPPANDECADAIALTAEIGLCTGTTAGTTTSSTESLPGCLGTANDDVWFSFVATGTDHDIEITNTGGATTDIVTEVFDACGGTSLECQDTPNSPINLTGLTVGVTYFFRVYTWSSVADTDTEFTVCVGSPPPPPANDLCADAIPLPVGIGTDCSNTVGANNSATDSGELPAPSCASYSGGDTWFSVTVPANGEVTVEMSSAGGFTDSGMSIYSGTCGALTEVECDDDDSPDGLFSSITLTGQTPGDVLLVRAWEFGNNAFGEFNICAFGAAASGCTDPCAPNFDATATTDDGSCEAYDNTCNQDCTAGPFGGTWDAATCACINETAPVLGCIDPAADNFDPAANCDDGGCMFSNPGCTDPCAPNFDATATTDDGSCEAYDNTCNQDCTAGPFGGTWDAATCACINETAPVLGCTDPSADNFDPAANCDDGGCIFSNPGCTDPCAPNFDATATTDDGSCEAYDNTCNQDCTAGPFGGTWDAATCACINETAPVLGCTDPSADNFDPAANCDDGGCILPTGTGDITDPCTCDGANNIDLAPTDGVFDLFFEEVTFSASAGAGLTDWSISFTSGTPADATGTDLALPLTNVVAAPGTGTPGEIVDNGDGTYTVFFYLDSGENYSAVADSPASGLTGANALTVSGGGCSPCSSADIPTLSQWGLITLALMLMSYGSVVMVGAGRLAGTNNLQLPIGGFQLPFNAAILRKAFVLTVVLAAVGYTMSIVLFGAIFFSDIIGVAISGPVFAYLVHLLYLIEKGK